jgi:outer membrane protein TolC
MFKFNLVRAATSIALVMASGCTVHPAGEREERDAALRAGKPFEKRFEGRQLSPLPAEATPDQLVEYALLNNAELEQRYWEWRSAIEQIPQDGTQSTTLNLAAGSSVTNGRASWRNTTVSLSNDPMTDIKWPSKLDAAAEEALENAKAAGRRFSGAQYELRDKVLSAYYDYALNAEIIRLEQRSREFLGVTVAVTEARSRAGSSGQGDVLTARNEAELAGSEIAKMESQLAGERATLNALLGRAVDAPLEVPARLPRARPLAYSDVEVIELAARRNPDLAGLADEIRGRGEGVRLAKLQYVPDFNLSAGTDLMGVTQSILGQATIPIFRYEAIDAAIAQAEANLRAAEAMRRQAGNDLAAQLIAESTFIRDADRQVEVFENTILPRARRAIILERSGYEAGQGSFLDLLNSQRSLIAIERLVADLEIGRAKSLVDLESRTACGLTVRP